MARTVAAILLRLLSSSVNLENAVNFLKVLISHEKIGFTFFILVFTALTSLFRKEGILMST